MENFDPRWQNFLRNLGWYLATIIVLIFLVRLIRAFPVILILWAVGLVWGGVLAYQFSRLLFGPEELVIGEEKLRAYLDQAMTYKARIDQAIRASAGSASKIHLDQLRDQVDTWTQAIADLVQRLNSLRQDRVIRRDLVAVPKAIANLETRLADETDPALRSQLERTLANRKRQLAALHELQNMVKRAEMLIENTLSMLGTIYSQILTGQSTSDVADYGQISADVKEEVRLLHDHLEALREVKLGRE